MLKSIERKTAAPALPGSEVRTRAVLDAAVDVTDRWRSAFDLKAIETYAQNVVKQALAFEINARTQETAITTWLSEAFNRDSICGLGTTHLC